MKTILSFILLLLLILSPTVYAQSGDISFWLPKKNAKSISAAQVKRNGEYFSIKLHSVFAHYKSSFLENIKKIIIVSETSTIEENKPAVQSTMLNKVWQKLDGNGDFIGVNDHLVVLSPATISNAKIKVSFQGIGEDKFGFVFDALSDSSFKSALSLSPATLSTIAAVAPTVKKLLASPYNTDNPRQILDVTQSYVVYADTKLPKVDSLREGFLIIISSREKKNADLKKIVSLDSKDIRLSPLGNGLEFKEADEWKQFTNNSYVVLSVTKIQSRGENEYSNWFSKYTEAERLTEEKLLSNKPVGEVRQEAINLWKEGNALLFADLNYIHKERIDIKSRHLNNIQTLFSSISGPTKEVLDPKNLGVPSNYRELALNYELYLAKQYGQITFRVKMDSGLPSQNRQYRITDFNTSSSMPIFQTTNEKGEFVIKDLSPGIYKIERKGETIFDSGIFIIDPKEKKTFVFQEEKKFLLPIKG